MKYWRLSVVMLAVGLGWSAIPVQEATAGETMAVDGVPEALTYQGRLVDEDGEPMTGGVELTYTIWDHPTEGAVLWQDVVDVEVDAGGFYSVVLGGDNNPIDTSVVADGQGWLGVAVEGDDEMEPRLSLTSVPYALAAGEARLAGSVAPGSIGLDALAEDFRFDIEHVEEATGQTLGGMSCVDGDVARFDGDDWYCDALPDGFVTDVTATAPVESTGGEDPNISMPRADESTDGYLAAEDFASFDSRVEDDDPRLTATEPLPGSDDYIQNQTSVDQNASFRIGGDGLVDGDVGIGTTAPEADLHVAGDAQIDGDLDVDGSMAIDDDLDLQHQDIRNMGTNTVNPLSEPLRVWAYLGGPDVEIESHQEFLEYQNNRELLRQGRIEHHHVLIPNIDGGDGGPDDDWDVAALSCRHDYIDNSGGDYNPESLCNLWDPSVEQYMTYFRGAIYAPESGTYTFATDSDDASELLINGEPVATWYGIHGDCDCWDNNGTVELEQGWHLFEYRQMERGTDDSWAAGWQKPGDSEIRHIPLNAFSSLSNPGASL